ncbi:MAG: cytochrome c3 family protein [Candidatus Aminicenantales bacterium]
MERMDVRRGILIGTVVFTALALISCGTSGGNGGNGGGGDGDGDVTAKTISATTMTYVAFAWNDLGMHCLNPTYDQGVILPPYNTVWVQVVKRGNPPQIVTAGITVEYAIHNNTYSYGKRSYGQFWDNMPLLFGVALAHDTGLNLEDPAIHNGLSGTMVVKGDHFQVNGIPVVPVDDSLTFNPYQIADITVRDSGTNAILVQTQATVPTSDEFNCAKCHAAGGEGSEHIPGGGGANVLANVLAAHDALSGTTLAASAPVLCASCHGSPALGQTGPGSSGFYLSRAVHGFHASRNAACYDCHPGQIAKCNRSIAHTASDGNCISCHGTLQDVASSIASGTRVPWVNEPQCATCHPGVAEVNTGTTLYRNASGHNGLSCPACHSSPHAMVPSSEASDNHQAIQYQTTVAPIGDCKVCHSTSKGGGINDFTDAHGGSRATACSVCHTAGPAANASQWPHQFQWKSR